jgi:hypothetical protein
MNQADIPVGKLRAAFSFMVLGAVMTVGALSVREVASLDLLEVLGRVPRRVRNPRDTG